MTEVSKSLGDIAQALGVDLRGSGNASITGVATLDGATPSQISFLINSRYRNQMRETRAAAVICSVDDAADCPVPALVCENPHATYARLAQIFAPEYGVLKGVHPSAVVSESAIIAESAWIGANCFVGDHAVIGSGCYIGPNCVVESGVVMGAGCQLIAQVTLCHHITLGQRIIVHPGAVIGSDGFGLAMDSGSWRKIPQLGSVQVGDDAEIGANSCIDRGALEDTVIEEDVRIDNQIQVAHNVRIGAHTAIAGCVGIAGSARIGRYCTIGGGVGIAGHLEITDNVHLTGMSLVTKSITEPGVYSSGLGVEPNKVWNKISARLRKIDQLARKLAALERRETK